MPSDSLIGLGDTKKAGDGTLSRKSEENRWSEYQEQTGEPIACEDKCESWKLWVQQEIMASSPSLAVRKVEGTTEPAKEQSHKDELAEATTEKNVDLGSLDKLEEENAKTRPSPNPKTKQDNTKMRSIGMIWCLFGTFQQLSLLFIALLILGGISLAASRPTTDQASIILNDQISELMGRKSFLTDATNSSGRANQMCEASGHTMLTINDINSTQKERLYYIMKGRPQVWLEHGPDGLKCKFLSTKALEDGFTDSTSCVRPDDPVGFKAICYYQGLTTESPNGHHTNMMSTQSAENSGSVVLKFVLIFVGLLLVAPFGMALWGSPIGIKKIRDLLKRVKEKDVTAARRNIERRSRPANVAETRV